MLKFILFFFSLVFAANLSAQTNLYGTIDINFAHYGSGSNIIPTKDVVNAGRSRIGFYNNQQLFSDSEFFYRIEWGTSVTHLIATKTFAANDTDNLSLDIKSRLAYVGIRSSWGTLMLGRLYSPFYLTVAKTAIELAGTGALAIEDVAVKRVSSSIVYKLPLIFSHLDVYLAAATGNVTPESASINTENGFSDFTFAMQYRLKNLVFGYSKYSSKGNSIDAVVHDDREVEGFSVVLNLNKRLIISVNEIRSHNNIGSKVLNDTVRSSRDVKHSGRDIALSMHLTDNSKFAVIMGKRNPSVSINSSTTQNNSKDSLNFSFSYQLGWDTLLYMVHETISENFDINADSVFGQNFTVSKNIYAGFSKKF